VTTAEKFLNMFLALVVFAAIIGVILFIASRFGGKRGDYMVAFLFLLPVVFMLGVGLLYPGIKTIINSFFDAPGTSFIGFDNYQKIFTSGDEIVVLRNTVIWVIITPFVATGVGLLYAILVDKARIEALAKAFIFLPMAISFVGASIIWRFVYEYRPDQPGVKQIGILNQILVWLGLEPRNWLVESPLNTLLLVIVMIWIAVLAVGLGSYAFRLTPLLLGFWVFRQLRPAKP